MSSQAPGMKTVTAREFRNRKIHEGWAQHQVPGAKMVGTLSIGSKTEVSDAGDCAIELKTESGTGEQKINIFKFDRGNECDLWKGFIMGLSQGVVPESVNLLPGQRRNIMETVREVKPHPPPLSSKRTPLNNILPPVPPPPPPGPPPIPLFSTSAEETAAQSDYAEPKDLGLTPHVTSPNHTRPLSPIGLTRKMSNRVVPDDVMFVTPQNAVAAQWAGPSQAAFIDEFGQIHHQGGGDANGFGMIPIEVVPPQFGVPYGADFVMPGASYGPRGELVFGGMPPPHEIMMPINYPQSAGVLFGVPNSQQVFAAPFSPGFQQYPPQAVAFDWSQDQHQHQPQFLHHSASNDGKTWREEKSPFVGVAFNRPQTANQQSNVVSQPRPSSTVETLRQLQQQQRQQLGGGVNSELNNQTRRSVMGWLTEQQETTELNKGTPRRSKSQTRLSSERPRVEEDEDEKGLTQEKKVGRGLTHEDVKRLNKPTRVAAHSGEEGDDEEEGGDGGKDVDDGTTVSSLRQLMRRQSQLAFRALDKEKPQSKSLSSKPADDSIPMRQAPDPPAPAGSPAPPAPSERLSQTSRSSQSLESSTTSPTIVTAAAAVAEMEKKGGALRLDQVDTVSLRELWKRQTAAAAANNAANSARDISPLSNSTRATSPRDVTPGGRSTSPPSRNPGNRRLLGNQTEVEGGPASQPPSTRLAPSRPPPPSPPHPAFIPSVSTSPPYLRPASPPTRRRPPAGNSNNNNAHPFYADPELNNTIPSWFMDCSRDKAETILSLARHSGNVLLRPSSTFETDGKYVISFRTDILGGSQVHHYSVIRTTAGFMIDVENKHGPMSCLSDIMLFFIKVVPHSKLLGPVNFSEALGQIITASSSSSSSAGGGFAASSQQQHWFHSSVDTSFT